MIGGGSGFAARPETSSRGAVTQPGQTDGYATDGRFASGGHDDWRPHHAYRPGAVYGFGYDYGDGYYNSPDVNQCFVYRKAYNARGVFVGWRRVNVCAG